MTRTGTRRRRVRLGGCQAHDVALASLSMYTQGWRLAVTVFALVCDDGCRICACLCSARASAKGQLQACWGRWTWARGFDESVQAMSTCHPLARHVRGPPLSTRRAGGWHQRASTAPNLGSGARRRGRAPVRCENLGACVLSCKRPKTPNLPP